MAFTTRLQPLYVALYLVSFLHLLFFSPTKGTTSGFTTHLIPRGSPLSPFYNPTSTHFDRLRDAFKRSLKRVNQLRSAIQAPVKPGGGEYLMKMSIGTPPVEVIGIIDTGSDLMWTQCLPCIACYHQTIPLFDPSHSSSYHIISCQSSICKSSKHLSCDKYLTCGYNLTFFDGSYSFGILASETLTLGTTKLVSLPNIAFGCGHDTGGIFDESGSGIIGLGSGKLSLISQMGQPFGQKFSYCLTPITNNSTSKISFGNDALVSGSEVVTTPIVTKSPHAYYSLSLEAISVGTERIAFMTPNNVAAEGNIIIDSGTTFTMLPKNVLDDLILALNKVIKLEKVEDPEGQFSACYKKCVGEKTKLPIITAHLKGGDVELYPINTFVRVNDDIVCLAMIADPEFSIYGNIAQINYLVGFDLEAGTVSFKPTDCTK